MHPSVSPAVPCYLVGNQPMILDTCSQQHSLYPKLSVRPPCLGFHLAPPDTTLTSQTPLVAQEQNDLISAALDLSAPLLLRKPLRRPAVITQQPMELRFQNPNIKYQIRAAALPNVNAYGRALTLYA
eukprot:366123-Chlamydomonas_euryale.AAC.7